MSDDPYKTPIDMEREATAMPYIVFVAALTSVCPLAMGLRSVMDPSDWYPYTMIVLSGLSIVFGGFRSEISSRVWKPYLAFPQILLHGTTVMMFATSILYPFGVNPKLDGEPLFLWVHLLFFSVMWARVCMVRYENWSARPEQADAGTEE